MRPKSILWFERLLLVAITIDLINKPSLADGLVAKGLTPAPFLILAMCLLSPGMGLIFWYLIARRGNNIARWLVTILVIAATIGFIATIFGNGGSEAHPTFLIAGLAELLKLGAVTQLFRRDARSWFTAK